MDIVLDILISTVVGTVTFIYLNKEIIKLILLLIIIFEMKSIKKFLKKDR